MEDLFITILICAVLLGIFLEHKFDQIKKRYKKLEKKYNDLAIKTGNEELATTFISEKDLEEICKLKEQGKIVKAVKFVRTQTEMDLLEAKQYVDDL
jgi:ribosomal protein L7/L12